MGGSIQLYQHITIELACTIILPHLMSVTKSSSRVTDDNGLDTKRSHHHTRGSFWQSLCRDAYPHLVTNAYTPEFIIFLLLSRPLSFFFPPAWGRFNFFFFNTNHLEWQQYPIRKIFRGGKSWRWSVLRSPARVSDPFFRASEMMGGVFGPPYASKVNCRGEHFGTVASRWRADG